VGLIQKITSLGMAIVLTVMSCIGVSAAPFSNLSYANAVAQIISEASPQILQVQYRHYGPGPGPRPWHERHYGHGDDVGIAIGLGIFGLMLGGMLAAETQRQEAINYCAQRFRSYDPQSMTYIGNDGLRHPCP